ncbi:pyridoxal 5'-phosphate synthase glutaminase subunit PdxT [Pectinatus brassicae]|uniref:Pyridoxal 5'-phosphate synthase subunit PdxT n=1 Tax=Pectinatus brassicae TaxID=862415 RepID=A0A840UT04_9FIRM|nr:pyridoxal 5'-phosphate synthase glutaminase subunit PdxT [Pectinatus brassicae]MBB5337272.1 5'-phosphate synthase pdxT subunit [Pectinatus brassicae]
MKTIGVLSMQGAVSEHLQKLQQVGVNAKRVRTQDDFSQIDGLIIPGGESTAIGKLLDDFNMTDFIREQIKNGLPVWGTCAGMILLAKNISNQEKTYLATMDITVQRNAYGSQLNSFVTEEKITQISPNKLPLIFIRAPYIESADTDVNILAVVDNNIVAAQQNNMLVTSFHPELTDNNDVHLYFKSMC